MTLNLTRALLIVSICLFGTQSLANESEQAGTKLKTIHVEGSSATMTMIKNDSAEYANKNKIGVTIKATKSYEGIACVRLGKCALAIGNMPITHKDAGATHMLDQVEFAIDSSVLITHPEVGVESLTTEQVKDVLEGRVKTWKELGGKDVPVVSLRREPKNGGRESEFYGVDPDKIEKFGVEVKTSPEGINRTKATPGGIASSGLGAAGPLDKQGIIKILKINGIAPNPESLRSGQYPFLRKLYMIRRKDRMTDPDVNNYVNFLMEIRPKMFEKAGMVIP